MLSRFTRQCSLLSVHRNFASAASQALEAPPTVRSAQKNLAQSQWKIGLVLKLVRGLRVPDALAQLTFSPKHRAREVSKIIKRAAVVARVKHDCLPEELYVKEIYCTKGRSHKRLRIMGRGRAGIGYTRWSHVQCVLEKIDFDQKILEADSANAKRRWLEKKEEVRSLRDGAKKYFAKEFLVKAKPVKNDEDEFM